MSTVQCPYVHKNGKQCSGKVERIERYHVGVEWEYNPETDVWELGIYDDGTHFHLFCDAVSEHNPPVKLWGRDLPDELQAVVYPGQVREAA